MCYNLSVNILGTDSCLKPYNYREYMVDLIGKPGCLCEPDSLLNGPSSISFCSPLHFPRLKPAEPTIDFRSLAKQYFSDCVSTELVFDSGVAGDIHVSYSMYDALNIVRIALL